MLVLSRKKGESLMIGGQIEVVVLDVEGDTVKIGIQAPKTVEILRKELWTAIQHANKEAAESQLLPSDLAKAAKGVKKKEEK